MYVFVYVGENSKDLIFRSIILPNSPIVKFYNYVTLNLKSIGISLTINKMNDLNFIINPRYKNPSISVLT